MVAPRTPLLATDIIIELADRPGRPIVLIRRKRPPRGWALPGGFVDVGETVETAAVREAREETALAVVLKRLFCVCSKPDRDPRGHTASVVYVAEARGDPEARDDAAAVAVFALNDLPQELAFDHARILTQYAHYRETGELPIPGPDTG